MNNSFAGIATLIASGMGLSIGSTGHRYPWVREQVEHLPVQPQPLTKRQKRRLKGR